MQPQPMHTPPQAHPFDPLPASYTLGSSFLAFYRQSSTATAAAGRPQPPPPSAAMDTASAAAVAEATAPASAIQPGCQQHTLTQMAQQQLNGSSESQLQPSGGVGPQLIAAASSLTTTTMQSTSQCTPATRQSSSNVGGAEVDSAAFTSSTISSSVAAGPAPLLAAASDPATPTHCGSSGSDGQATHDLTPVVPVAQFGSSQRWQPPDIPALLAAAIDQADKEAQSSTAQQTAAVSQANHPSSSHESLAERERERRVRLLQFHSSLLRELLQLLQAAHSGTLVNEIDPRPFARPFASDDGDTLLRMRLPGGLSLMHVLILGAPPTPADADSWTDIAEAARMLGEGCFRRQWAYQLEPLMDLFMAHQQNRKGDSNSDGSGSPFRRLLNAPDDHGPARNQAQVTQFNLRSASKAANQGRADLVALLLKHGADTEVVNRSGLTPSDCTEWDRVQAQSSQAAAGVGPAAPSSVAHAPSFPAILCSATGPAGSGQAAAGSEAGAAEVISSADAAEPKITLACPKCARVYSFQFRLDAHVSRCDGVQRLPRGRRRGSGDGRDEASAEAGPSRSTRESLKRKAAPSFDGEATVTGTAQPAGKRVRPSLLVVTSPRMIPPSTALSVTSGTGLCLAGLLGLAYGQRLAANQFKGESGRAACRRLLLQAKLAAAADRGDDGDLDAVRDLVAEWHAAARQGARMHPLCYRMCSSSPLAVAVAYVNNRDNAILKELLRLPHLFYTQSAQHERHCSQTVDGRLHTEWRLVLGQTLLAAAAFAANPEGLQLLLEAGVDPNWADLFDGSPLLRDCSRLDSPALRCRMVWALLDAGAKLSWNALGSGRARSALSLTDAVAGVGVSHDIVMWIQHRRDKGQGR